GVDALLDRLARIARAAIIAVVPVIPIVAAPVVARGRSDRGDPADDQRARDDVACIDAIAAVSVPAAPLRLRGRGGTHRHRASRDGSDQGFGNGFHGLLLSYRRGEAPPHDLKVRPMPL